MNEELRDLKAAGADIVQIDEPYLQARPEPAREYAVEAIDRALDGIEGKTVLHTCFGYAHIVHTRLPGYPFLAELDACAATTISHRGGAAEPRSGGAARASPRRRSSSACSTWARPRRRPPEIVAERIRRALEVVPAERLVVAPDCGMKYLPRDARVREARGDGCRGAARRGGSSAVTDAPKTRIAQAFPDRVEVRGRDLTGDLMGRLSFTEYFHLLLTGASRPRSSGSSSTCCSSRSPSTG